MHSALLFHHGAVLVQFVMFSLARKEGWIEELREVLKYKEDFHKRFYFISTQWPSGWFSRLCSWVLSWRLWGLKSSSCSAHQAICPDTRQSQPKGPPFPHSHRAVPWASWGLTCMTPEDRIRSKGWKLSRCWLVVSIRKRCFINLMSYNSYNNPEKETTIIALTL